MKLQFEKDAIVVTVGAMGTGKSTFLRKRLSKHHIVSTDDLREQLCGDFTNQAVSGLMFEILDVMLAVRARGGLFTVVDSTGTERVLSKAVELARRYKRPLYALKFPPVPESELTSERMQHRMSVLPAYHRQVERVKQTIFHKDFTVIEIPETDRDAIEIRVGAADSKCTHDLPEEYRYVVVPDLHGECSALDEVEKQLKADKNLRAIQLGDIVDRGESSCETFRRVYDLWNRGLMYVVPGNHDNKFYRWAQKYLAAADKRDEGFEAGLQSNFGMSLKNGLDKTIAEFGSLTKTERLEYATDWCHFYKSLPLYLKLKRGKTMNFFVHAGITPEMMNGWEPSKRDISQALYASITDPRDVRIIAEGVFGEAIRKGDIDGVTVHVGHTFGYVRKNTVALAEDDGPYRLYSHDIGLGKRPIHYAPEFVVL